MMRQLLRKGTWCALLIAGAALLTPIEPTAAAEYQGVVSAKAVKYLDVLRKRPEPGYLFDRFYNTWLDEATVEDLQSYLTAQAAESKSTADQLLLAFFHAKQGDDVAALEEFRRALATDPASALTWYQKAVVEARTLDFETAIADLRKARDAKPDEKLAVLVDKLLGKLLVRNEQMDEAAKVWSELRAAHPQDQDLAEDLIELHIDEGLYKQAAELNEALIKETKDPYLAVTRRLRLGDIHYRAGDRDKALAAYGTSLEDVGADTWLEQEILAQTEQLFRREDDLAKLKAHYDELLKQHPKRIGLHRKYAKLLVEIAEQDAAIAAYKKILELTPGDRTNREEYVEMLAKIGKRDEAIAELNSLCEQHPEDAELRFRLATLYHDAGKKEEAAKAATDYLAASDKSEYAYLRAARLLERFELKDAAEGVYREMVAAFADSPSTQEAYAVFLYSQDKKDEAIALWRKLAEGADLPQALHVARALSARGEDAVALELLKAREADFAKEPLYYSQMATAALALKEPAQAVPWIRRRVELATQVPELEAALDQAKLVCDRADQVESLAAELDQAPRRSVQQTCLLAELLELAGDSEKADAALAKLAEEGNLLAVSEQIRLHTERRDWTAAADATRRMLELPGGRKSIHVRRLVELCQRDFQIAEALKWIDEWKKLSPGSTSPWTAEAGLLRLEGKDDAALAVLKSAAQKFEADEDLRLRLAQTYTETEHYGDAERIFWQLYDDTEDVTGKLRWAQELAKLAEQQGKVSQLVENFEERRRSNRQSIVPLLALSEVHRVADNYEGRRQALTAAAKIKPDDLELLHQIARIEEQEGDWNEAIATLQRAVELDKTDRTRQRIAQLHISFGNPDDGFAILFELAGADKADPRTLEAIADAMCGLQEWERAADFLSQRIAEHPADYRLRYLFAVAAEEADRIDEATAHFLELLEGQEELAGAAKKNQTANQMNSYYEIIARITPPKVVEWMQFSQYQYTAYAHRQQQGRYVSPMPSGGAGGVVQMPPKVDAVRPMALAHLATIAQTLEEDAVEQLANSLGQRGVDEAKILIRMGADQGNVVNALPELLEENPDNEFALAITVLYQTGQRNPELAKHGVAAAEKFREKYPELAMMAALQAGAFEMSQQAAEESPEESETPKPNKWLDEALAMAEKFDKPNPMLVMSVSSMLAGRPFNSEPLALEEGYRTKLSQLLLRWYPEMQQNPIYGQWAFFSVLGALTRGEDPSAYIAFLEDEVARWRKEGGSRGRGGAQPSMFGYSSQQGFLAPMTFPPQKLADFPDNVLALLQSPGENNPMVSMYGQNVESDFNEEKLTAAIDKVRDPVLRLLLANRFEKTELVDKLLQEMLAAKQPRLDAFLLAAAKASADEKHAEAVELLGKARFLPMHRDIRGKVDASIVAAVLAAKLDSEKPPAEKLAEAGRAACLRLRQGRLEANNRTELIAAMEELGLKKEAAKLDKIASAQGTPTSSVGSVLVARAAPTPASKDRVAELIADGKTDAAVKLVTNEVLNHARQMLAQPGNASYMRYQAREIKQRLDALDLTDKVVESLDPGDSDNTRRLSEYALACEMFNMHDKARAAYERLVEKRPKDDAMRYRLILLLAPEDPAKAEEHLAKLSPASSSTMGQMMWQQMQDYEMSLDERVVVAEVAAKYLKLLAGNDKADASWSVTLVQMLASHMHTNRGGSLPSLYAKKSDQNVAKPQAKVMERRRAAHRDLCEQMLKWPGAAKAGFSHLLGAAEAQGEVGEDFLKRAEEVLRLEAEPKGRNLVAHGQYYYNTSNSGEVRLQTPEEYLVRTAAAKNDWAHLDGELLPALANAKDKTPHKQLETLMALYRCTPEEFLAAAEKAVKSGGTAVGQMNDGSELNVVVAAWSDRKLEVDVEPLVLDRLKKISKGNNHHQTPACLPSYIKATRELRGNAAALALMEKIAEVYLGPSDKREAFLQRHNTNQGISYGQPSGQIYVYGHFMGRLIQQQGMVLLALKHLQDSPGSMTLDNIEHYSSSGVNNLSHKPIKEVMAVISDSAWTADLDGFSPLNIGARNQGHESWLAYFLRSFLNNQERRKEFTAAIEEQLKAKPTFGLGLIDAQLRGEKEVAAYLAKHLDAINALDEPRQLEIASHVKSVGGAKLLAAAADNADLAAVHKWLAGSGNLQAQELLETARKAKRLEDLGGHTYQVVENFGGQIKSLLATDPDTARELFFRYVELSEDAVKRGQWQMHFGDGTSTPGYLLRTVAQQADSDDMSLLPLLVDVVKNDRGVAVEYGDGPRNAVNNILRERYEALVNQKAPPAEAFQKLYAELGATLGDRPASLFVDSLYEACTQRLHDKKLQGEMIAWLNSEAAAKEHPQLAADFRAVLTLMRLERAAGNEKALAEISAEDRQQCFGRFAELMADEQLPLSWRLLSAACVVRHGGEQLPPEIGKNALVLFTAAIDAGTPLTSEQHRALVRWIAKHQDSPDLQESLAAWREQWGKRFLRPAGSGSASRQAQGNRVNDADILCKALEMYIKAGDEDRVNLLLRHYDPQLANMPTVIALLLRADKPELAARFIRSHWAEISIDWPAEEATVYDETIQGREAALSEKLQRDDERFFARTLLASMPTAGVKPGGDQNGEEPADPARDERLTKLAQEFAGVAFKDDSFKLRTLTLLSRNAPAGALLADAIAEQYRQLNLPLTMQQNDARRWQLESELAARHFTNQFRQGQTQDFVAVFDKLVTNIDPNNPYNYSHKIEPLINCCFESLRADGDKWTVEQCAAVGKSLRGLLVNQDQLHLNNFLTYNNVLFITHVRSGNVPALKKWRADLGRNPRSWTSSRGLGQRVWTTLSKVVGEPTPDNLAERIRTVEKAINCASHQEWLVFAQARPHWVRGFDQSSVFKHILDAKLLSKEELLAYATNAETPAKRPHMVDVTLAEWLRGEKKHREAAELFERSVARAPEAWKLRKRHWTLDAATEWAHADEFDKATKLVEEVAAGETRDLDKELIKRVRKLIEQRQAAQKPGRAAPQAGQKATTDAAPSARLRKSVRSLLGRTTPRFAAAV